MQTTCPPPHATLLPGMASMRDTGMAAGLGPGPTPEIGKIFKEIALKLQNAYKWSNFQKIFPLRRLSAP